MYKLQAIACAVLAAGQVASATSATDAKTAFAAVDIKNVVSVSQTCEVEDIERCALKHNFIRPASTACGTFLGDLENYFQCVVNVGCKAEAQALLRLDSTCQVVNGNGQLICNLCSDIRPKVPAMVQGNEPDFEAWKECKALELRTCVNQIPGPTAFTPDSRLCSVLETWFPGPVKCAKEKGCPVEIIDSQWATPQCEVFLDAISDQLTCDRIECSTLEGGNTSPTPSTPSTPPNSATGLRAGLVTVAATALLARLA